MDVRAHVHEDFCAKFVEYARKIQRNAMFLLHRPFMVTTDGAQVCKKNRMLLQEKVKLMDERTNSMRFFNLEFVLILSHPNFMHMQIYQT